MSVTVTSPAPGATVKGTIQVTATTSVKRFELATLTLDGRQVGGPDLALPISFSLDTTKWPDGTPIPDGNHAIGVSVKYLTAGGRDRWQSSPGVVVAIQNLVVPPPPPPPSGGCYWGAGMDGPDTYAHYYGNPAPDGRNWVNAPWGNTGNTWERFEQNAGKKVSLCGMGMYPPWMNQSFDVNAFTIMFNRGAIPLVFMGQNIDVLADVAAGKHDAAIGAWADAVKAWGKPFFYRPWSEMNGDWWSWGQATPASVYVAAWRHLKDVCDQHGATNITWLWNININYFAAATPRYPGDGYVDWTGIDGYNKGASSVPFATIYKPTYDYLLQLAPTKPIIIPEVGSVEYAAGVKAAWITDMLKNGLPQFPKIRGVMWFNWYFQQTNFPIESSPATQAAFHDAIQDARYLAGAPVASWPALSKVPVPA